MTDTSFSARLRKVREAAGLSQYALAKKTGLSKQAVSQLELGQSVPSWPTVQLLASVLGLDCRAFIDLALQPPDAEPSRPRGRPRKDAAQGEPVPAKKPRKRKRG